ncbi:MAG: hypothetical protein ACOX3E_01600 [Desulfomonilia bacterium]|jgi:hypothetical protein|uniref:Uncharacterized protein n=1 Tax=anaerobic digester metagenome TaxID=1263854 RepID=A0A485M2L1_9ZZZZ|nr:hypothetical protein [Pseudomonadota bacterium]HON39271.1 hypothetical protein [Deltaproteobacteria bacterium]HRS57096.1 hypothetical protein [Desulfomonilia bacterium]HPD20226.1 hypothetical protein [Deltaproteobacteria bacterium]HPX19247.1 hypothetical protein [Deltaproteobacteria bacterium]
MNRVYKIKKNLQIPMILATLLSIPIFVDVILSGFELSILLMALALMILFYILTLNNLLRKVRITDSAVTIGGILGPRKIPIGDIVRLDGITMGSRQFISLTTNKRSFLIPNSFAGFQDIISDLESLVHTEVSGSGLSALKEHVIVRRSDITGAWITVILLFIIIIIRFFPR